LDPACYPLSYLLNTSLARLPTLGPEIPQTGSAFSRALGRWVLRVMGWSVQGNIPNLPKLVLIAAPHTSNWDFIVGVAAKLALGLDAMWMGKDSLFRGPLGHVMRRLGGRPVDRAASHDVVREMVGEFNRRERLVLALAPEGTRKRVERWRTGFYHIAHAARVPIVPVALNFGARAIQIGSPFTTTGDVDADVHTLQQRFADVRGRRAR
jgi:1-acyl-sn-glycerol-3-phosphate acyltransferase